MAHVDALSRAVYYVETLPLEKELQYRQLQDPKIKLIVKDLEFEYHVIKILSSSKVLFSERD